MWSFFYSNPVERTTDVVATVAVSSVLWLDVLEMFSKVSALLLPILGCTWLIVQVITHLWKLRRGL